MRIILINKFYYPRGGDCIYTIELAKLLKNNGHEIAVFAMEFPENIGSVYEKYFPKAVDFKIRKILEFIKGVRRIFGKGVKKKFIELINEFNPDIVHLNNIHSQISPIVANIAKIRGIPVVWTLHDYKLLCPRYDCRRSGEICELCFHDKLNVIKYKCLKNSYLVSAIAYLESIYWSKKKLEKYTDYFVCPSMYLFNCMLRGGFERTKLRYLTNFNTDKDLIISNSGRDLYYIFVGRLSDEKGVRRLLQAATLIPEYKLKVIGTGPLEKSLKLNYISENIEFLGFKNWDELKPLIEMAVCTVVPSEWVENNPLTIIESLCLGTPVIGSNIGGIPELIEVQKNGLLFEPGDTKDLVDKIRYMMNNQLMFRREKIALNAQSKFSAENYYCQIVNLYSSLINNMNI
jgi:glycosyltransferase involved in cell wall biosynthesis